MCSPLYCPPSSAGLQGATLHVQLALLLLLPREVRGEATALRQRSRSPSGTLSHTSTVRLDHYRDWLERDSSSSGYR